MWLASNRDNYELLQDALHLFSRCHLLTGNPEAGINTATLLLLSGNEEEAYRKASEVAGHCRNLIMDGTVELDGYLAAIIGEANLIRGRHEAAQSWYETACSQDESITEVFRENMNLLLDHTVPESKTVKKIRRALRA
jgi:hypothetical protein